jgi:hypothetical protein
MSAISALLRKVDVPEAAELATAIDDIVGRVRKGSQLQMAEFAWRQLRTRANEIDAAIRDAIARRVGAPYHIDKDLERKIIELSAEREGLNEQIRPALTARLECTRPLSRKIDWGIGATA